MPDPQLGTSARMTESQARESQVHTILAALDKVTTGLEFCAEQMEDRLSRVLLPNKAEQPTSLTKPVFVSLAQDLHNFHDRLDCVRTHFQEMLDNLEL